MWRSTFQQPQKHSNSWNQIRRQFQHNFAGSTSKVPFTTSQHQRQQSVFLGAALASFLIVDNFDKRQDTASSVVHCHGAPPPSPSTTCKSRREQLETFLASLKQKAKVKLHLLPEYTSQDVAKHNGQQQQEDAEEAEVWMSYAGYVYNVTRFIPLHPGGTERISRAAGKAMEPFWYLHQQHFETQEPMQILEGLMIGTLAEADQAKIDQDLEKLIDDIEGFRLEIISVANNKDEGTTAKSRSGIQQQLSLEDLKALPQTDRKSQVGCDQNEKTKVRPSVLFGGVLLRDLLSPSQLAAIQERGVAFHAMDGETVTLSNYKEDDYGNILMAYEENGAPLTQARGFPLRVIIPGRRVIKWVKQIEVL